MFAKDWSGDEMKFAHKDFIKRLQQRGIIYKNVHNDLVMKIFMNKVLAE